VGQKRSMGLYELHPTKQEYYTLKLSEKLQIPEYEINSAKSGLFLHSYKGKDFKFHYNVIVQGSTEIGVHNKIALCHKATAFHRLKPNFDS
jgi:hypothetical protein